MKIIDNERKSNLNINEVNIISGDNIYELPVLMQEFAIVELILLSRNGYARVQSSFHPIRHGKHCGTTVLLGYGTIDLNPKFIWNGKEWLLNTFGTILFAEIEVNPPRREHEDN